MKLTLPSKVSLFTETDELVFDGAASIDAGVAEIGMSLREDRLLLSVRADKTPLCWLRLRFASETPRTGVRVMGDAFERSYGDLAWRGIEPERVMPWYMLVSDGSDQNPDAAGRLTEGFGVAVRPSAIVVWQYDGAGVTLWADLRCGCRGVILGGRTLEVCEILFGEYRDISAFEAGKRFCAAMSPHPLPCRTPIYGSNNWYYSYGHSSREQIMDSTRILANLCRKADARPYMVVDSGWEKHPLDAPWDESNERFPDMAVLADEMREYGVRPGIWIRYLRDESRSLSGVPAEARQTRDPAYLDPSHPWTADYVRRMTVMMRQWGYELIKHDFSTWDMFGQWGFEMKGAMASGNWSFYDRGRTSAEITVDFYRTIREAAGDTVIIGCNTISHLCAGLVEANRIGDDTSGLEFERTRKMGINTLAFRLMQNGSFYAADADCAGITGKIEEKAGRQWLELLAASGTPLFISCDPALTADWERELEPALLRNACGREEAIPLDWMETLCPELWRIGGEQKRFRWYDALGASEFAPVHRL